MPSPGLQVSVVDPCLNTQIIPGDIVTVMQAPILGGDSLNLFTELGIAWPWTDTVDQDVPDSIAIGVCGPLEYFVVTNTPLPQPTNLVSLVGDTLYFNPTYEHEPGNRMVPLLLGARLTAYPMIPVAYDAFNVFIQDCNTEIIANDVVNALQTQYIDWYAAPQPYFSSSALGLYAMTFDCEYNFSVTPKLLVGGELVSLPSWFSFDQ